jgi:Arc/MetJ-type ribon-helix-helix transcriptional regulator
MEPGDSVEVALPADLTRQVQDELATGRYRDAGQLVEEALRRFLDEEQRGRRRLDALRRIGQAVDDAGLYDRVQLPDPE